MKSSLSSYIISKSSMPSKLAQKLADITREKHPLGRMVCGEIVASFLNFIIKSHRIKNILEIGTFTGYSALAMAEALPTDGKVITVDKNKKINKVASEYWDKSEHGSKITALFGEGVKVIPELEQSFDLVFIDADKGNYINYLELSLEKLAQNGIIIVDNVLWNERVVDPEFNEDKVTVQIKKFNDYVEEREDLVKCLLPVRDGLFLIKPLVSS